MRSVIEAIAKRLGFIPQASFDVACASLTGANMVIDGLRETTRMAQKQAAEASRRASEAMHDNVLLRRRNDQLEDDLWNRNPLPPLASYFNVQSGQLLSAETSVVTHRIMLTPERHAVCFAVFPEEAELYKRNAAAFAERWAREFAQAMKPRLEETLASI